MPILSGDIKLVASQVMDDVPEGGGQPTALVIADGVSNAIFPDISELDRAGGRVNLRKLHVSVQTDDRDTYMGTNVIVAEPPADPNVSVTLFSTRDTFDRRTEAASRIESYLNKGPTWVGYLYENHITGQRSVQLFQRPEAELPPIGRTLVLVQNEGKPDQQQQYIRATDVVSVERAFYDINSGKDYAAAIVTISLSDALRFDLVGSPASRNFTPLTTAAKVRDTVVADAGTYAGVVPLARAAALGDFTLPAANIYSQLVPSAQTEVPIVDVRTNGLSAALVATGGPITQTITTGLTTATSMHVGGPILPASLTITAAGVSASDKGGLLVSSSAEVGQVDYDNGIVSLSTNLWGGGTNTFTVTFTPATAPDLISDQRAISVTADSRALNYTLVMQPPLPRTTTVSYLAQGRWYVLRDAGAGVLAGISSAYGAGTVNYTTGSVLVTLGALPDVGSSIIIQAYTDQTAVKSSNTMLANSARVFAPLNTSGDASLGAGSKPIGMGSLGVSWNDGSVRLAIDDGFGNLTGDASGTVDYTRGVVRISPNLLPPLGTTFLLDSSSGTVETRTIILATPDIGSTNITPGSVSFIVSLRNTFTLSYSQATPKSTAMDTSVVVYDDGAGVLKFDDAGNGPVAVGTINYATGELTINTSPSVAVASVYGPVVNYAANPAGYIWQYAWNNAPGFAGRGRSAQLVSASTTVYFSTDLPGPDSVSIEVNQYLAQTVMVPNYSLKGVRFTLGGSAYAQMTDSTLLRDVSPTTGGGTPAGSVSAAIGTVSISDWTVGVSPVITDWRGLIAPPGVGLAAPFAAFNTTFRTASSPLRPGSLSVLGTLQDGTTFNETSDISGKINGTRVKGRVDYQYGLVELYFVNPAGDHAFDTDLSALQIAGLTTLPADLAMLATLRYNAVAYSYLPLDADLLGIDPVRLPSDGRVPIFRPGGFAVVGHTGKITATVTNGQTIDCARVRLSRVRVVGQDGTVINTGYTSDLEAGLVTFANVSSYSQPITIEHRIEDMGVVRDVQISGEVTFTRPITHNYPLGSYLSSALVAGDLKSRVSVQFDQQTWSNIWLDAPAGSSAVGTFNDVLAPIVVTNRGALTERWALVFTNTTAYNVIGEHIGVIATGSTGADLAPLNPATATPYFTVPALGWGIGWAAGNVLRFNTIGAMTPVWVVRTVQQGPNTGTEHSFTLLSRGDVDRP